MHLVATTGDEQVTDPVVLGPDRPEPLALDLVPVSLEVVVGEQRLLPVDPDSGIPTTTQAQHGIGADVLLEVEQDATAGVRLDGDGLSHQQTGPGAHLGGDRVSGPDRDPGGRAARELGDQPDGTDVEGGLPLRREDGRHEQAVGGHLVRELPRARLLQDADGAPAERVEASLPPPGKAPAVELEPQTTHPGHAAITEAVTRERNGLPAAGTGAQLRVVLGGDQEPV